MNKKVLTLLVTIFLCLVLLVACAYFHPGLPSVKGERHTGTLLQKSVDGTLANDAENGYENTKRFLSELAIPERIISEFSDDELDFFTRSDSIAAFSNDGLENDLGMRQIIAMHTTGRMRLYSDIEWHSLPENRYKDVISINMIPQILPSYENASVSVSYNGITKELSPETDYKIIICDYLGQVGVRFDLGKALKGVKEVDENGVRIHFEIDVFNAAYREYENFNLLLHYQHLRAEYNGDIGDKGSRLGYLYTEKSRIYMTYYEIGPSVPLSYFPDGFQKTD